MNKGQKSESLCHCDDSSFLKMFIRETIRVPGNRDAQGASGHAGEGFMVVCLIIHLTGKFNYKDIALTQNLNSVII